MSRPKDQTPIHMSVSTHSVLKNFYQPENPVKVIGWDKVQYECADPLQIILGW
jgi:hypothetical protein